MSNALVCYGCQAGLPITAPADQPTVKCSYCGNPNKNPNFTRTDNPKEESEETSTKTTIKKIPAKKQQEISLKPSPLFSLYSGSTHLFSVVVMLIFLFFPQHYLVYFLAGIIAIMPVISTYFVEAKWEKIAQHLTASTGEFYRVNYEFENYGWHQFISYIFVTSFVYSVSEKLMLLKYPALSLDGKVGVFLISATLGIGFVWFLEKLIEVLGVSAGKFFSKEP